MPTKWAAIRCSYNEEACLIPACTGSTHLQYKEPHRKPASDGASHWWTRGDSNPRPLRCERSALPAELQALKHNPLYNRCCLSPSIFRTQLVELLVQTGRTQLYSIVLLTFTPHFHPSSSQLRATAQHDGDQMSPATFRLLCSSPKLPNRWLLRVPASTGIAIKPSGPALR